MKRVTEKKPIPFRFVLDEIASLNPYTKPMFGATGVYVGDKIVLILRDRESSPEDNGAWLATGPLHHESLLEELPSMRSIALFGPGTTGWQVVPAESDSFEEEMMRVCELLCAGDERIGKVPKSRKLKASAKKKTQKKTAKRKKK